MGVLHAVVTGDLLSEGELVEVSFMLDESGNVFAGIACTDSFFQTVNDYEMKEIQKAVKRVLWVVSTVENRIKHQSGADRPDRATRS